MITTATNQQDVAIVPACEECGERWLPGDAERWLAVSEVPSSNLGAPIRKALL
jgi:hypothetical protein